MLDQLFVKYNVPTNISFIARVQTLISKHNCNYDIIIDLYNYELLKEKYNV